ncbi:MAG: ATP-binding protein [Elusimicrobiota bacterium]
MSGNIRINSIKARNLGPVGSFSLKAGDLNLIYGKNESGKTYIVEFIIRCLFKNKGWQLRDEAGEGKIVIEGLEDKSSSFSVSSRKKLGHFLSEKLPGLPPAMDKLLIVKGADVEIPRPVSKNNHMDILRHYLSGREVLGEIEGKIKKTIKKAEVKNNTLNIESKTNLARLRENADKERKKIKALLEEINQKYSAGAIFNLKSEIEKLNRKKEKFEKAKRHLAFIIQSGLDEQEKKLKELPNESLINQLGGEIAGYRSLKSQVEELRLEVEKKEDSLKHLPWLKEAEKTYTELMRSGVSPVFYRWLLVVVIALAAGVLFINPAAALIPLAFAALLPFILKGRSISAREEIKSIKENYRNYFASELKDSAVIKAKLEKLKEKKLRNETVKERLRSLKEKASSLKEKIESYFIKIGGDIPGENEWTEKIEEVNEKRRKIKSNINDSRLKLSSLNVEEKDYLREEVKFSYDREEEKNNLREMEELKAELRDKKKFMDDIRLRAREITGVRELNDSNLVEELYRAQETALKEYKKHTASILGQYCLAEVVKELSRQEDDKIKKTLEKETFKAPVKNLSGRYESFSLKENKLFLSDGYAQYSLEDLSTGAREQFFLALRLGMAAELLRKNRIFFVLDDAFQYSDYPRRKNMVDKTIKLAEQGWQVFYFTMDDHIRDLFMEGGEKAAPDFVFKDIND